MQGEGQRKETGRTRGRTRRRARLAATLAALLAGAACGTRMPAGARIQDAALFADPDVRLTWEPTDAGVFEDRRHGFTRGRYKVLTTGPEGKEPRVTAGGAYLTIWRREGDGWKVILDTGSPDPVH